MAPTIADARAALLADPDRSNRDAARETGCSAYLVGVARRQLEAEGQLVSVEQRRTAKATARREATQAKAAEARRLAAEAKAARRLARGGPAACVSCGAGGHRPRGEAVPFGWGVDCRCRQCVRAGRYPAPVKVRHVRPGSMRTGARS
jgi:hypothetical protein